MLKPYSPLLGEMPALTPALIKSNWVGPEGGAVLVEETVSAIKELFADVEYPRPR